MIKGLITAIMNRFKFGGRRTVPSPVTQQTSVPPPVQRQTSVPPPVTQQTSVPPPVQRQVSGPPPVQRQVSGPPPVTQQTSVPPPVQRQVSGPPPVTQQTSGRVRDAEFHTVPPPPTQSSGILGATSRFAGTFTSGERTGRRIMGGIALYTAGSTIKTFSTSYQQTPGFEDLSPVGQGAFKGAAWLAGSAMQVKGVFGTAGHLAGKANLTKTSKVLNYIGDLKPATGGLRLLGKGAKWATTTLPINTAKGVAQYGALTARSIRTGFRDRSVIKGLDSFSNSVATMDNPYLGAMGVGMVMAAPGAMSNYKKTNNSPRSQGMQGMNRGNYNRVSNRDRRLGV